MDTRWKPNVTVATLVEREHKYLLVHEHIDNQSVYNQPAGHLNKGESLIAAAKRETLEETAYEVEITHYLGMYRYIAANGTTYLRHGFTGSVRKHCADYPLDKGIIEAVWMSYADIVGHLDQMRSPLVKQLVDDYLKGEFYPLALLHE
ncbi:MAG: NUDIX hydrolase [Pseudomonadota bacterium]